MADDLHGSVLVFILYDVCEEINLEKLRQILGLQPAGREPAFKHAAPEYVRFERPPVMETLPPTILDSGECFQVRLKYYNYGVTSVEFELPFRTTWEGLVNLSARFISNPDLERRALEVVREKVKRAAPALQKAYENWLDEDYSIFHVCEMSEQQTAAELRERHGSSIAQIARGETRPLSDAEVREILQSSMSYYPEDLAVISWNAAFVYDTPSGAETTIQLLEYANSQLLEFRHYDEALTRRLEFVYQSLERGAGFLFRWRSARTSAHLQAQMLEVNELAERADNAIKFLSDMYSARLYRLAAAKVGVPDYKRLVHEKMHAAENLYGFLVDRYHQGRAFVLELMVVVILIIELVFLFKGIS